MKANRGARQHVPPAKPRRRTLTQQQRLAVEVWVATGSLAAAGRAAGVSKQAVQKWTDTPSRPWKRAEAELRAKVAVAVAEREPGLILTAIETQQLASEHARATIAYFLDAAGQIDLLSDQAKAHLHLIKSVREHRDGSVEIRLVDTQKAVDQLARMHGLYREESADRGRAMDVMVWAQFFSTLPAEKLRQAHLLALRRTEDGAPTLVLPVSAASGGGNGNGNGHETH